MARDYVARRLRINGIVQGVGFRPFVFQLAQKHGLQGEVANTAAGVSIHVEGTLASIEAFRWDLVSRHPPLAHITTVDVDDDAVVGHNGFRITRSRGEASKATLISPDVSICADCLAELFDPADRRYRYPFINCTNCGPRYTIIDDIPYDRPHTSMKHFRMCPQCQAEYDDPADRRFHAQPNACPVCGPRVTLCDKRQNVLAAADPIAEAAALLRRGAVVAVKGLGGYHLAVDAGNNEAVVALRRRKRREEKPLALMSVDLEAIRRYARVGPAEEALLTSMQRPITLLRKRAKPGQPAPAEAVAPSNRYYGVMLPYTPLHYLLLDCGPDTLVMTSGNLSEEPIAIDNAEASARLGDIADYFLSHDRDIYLRSDDSIVRHCEGEARFVRRSRGYVPRPVFVRQSLPAVVACGAELKNTVCLTKGQQAFLSQHIGDLENEATYAFLEMTIEHMQRILDIKPEIVAYDLHPDYLSTRYALQRRDLQPVGVQHHHAHIVACMAEHHLSGPVIGLAFDGTGYGPDGTVWGGEILIARDDGYERAAHLAHVSMPGSAAAIKEPWRMAVSYLVDAYGEDFEGLGLPSVAMLDSDKLRIIREMIAKGVNCPQTSSLGRLFDGVAALAGLRHQVAFEGQAAMELEMIADETVDRTYPWQWAQTSPRQIPVAPIIRAVVEDLCRGVPAAVVSGRFHATLAALFTDLTRSLARETGLKTVALSGGVFQNAVFLQSLTRALKTEGLKVYSHRLVPANDGGISLGQAVAAAAMARQAA